MRFAQISVLLTGLSLAAAVHAAGMDDFLGKEGAKTPAGKTIGTGNVKVANPEGTIVNRQGSFSTPGGGASEGAPSQQQLAARYKKHHSNKDCESLKKLADWAGVDFWRKEGFTDELCSNGYNEITDIKFLPVDSSKLNIIKPNGEQREYTLPPVSTMHVEFAPQKFAKNTAPGAAPTLDFMVAKNAAGNFVLVTTKRKQK